MFEYPSRRSRGYRAEDGYIDRTATKVQRPNRTSNQADHSQLGSELDFEHRAWCDLFALQGWGCTEWGLQSKCGCPLLQQCCLRFPKLVSQVLVICSLNRSPLNKIQLK